MPDPIPPATRGDLPAPPRMPIDLPLARGRHITVPHTLVMGILNVTPDSFSDGGELTGPDAVVARAQAMLDAGADLLDVGGESTRPDHAPVPAEEEARRVVPAVQALRTAFPEAVLSVDTRKGSVARAALAAGADWVNDVSGLSDPDLAAAVAEAGCGVVAMRCQDLAGASSPDVLVAACAAECTRILDRAHAAGIPRHHVVLDPGLGFGDPPGGDPAANLALVDRIPDWSQGLPVLVGASRKRFVGAASRVQEPKERVAGSVAVAVLAALRGAAIVRVHDVAPTVEALRVLAAVP